METIELNDWAEFHVVLGELQDRIEKAREGRDHITRDVWIYRGQSNSQWKLQTTLERYDGTVNGCLDYYRRAYKAKHHIEALTARRIDAPTPPEYEALLHKEDEPFGFDDYPAYGYLAYLRHHGYPSPLLDWSKSPYVAAFFAFRHATAANGRVAVFALAEYYAGMKVLAAGEPAIHGRGPYVTTDQRHVLQQCRYTTCTVKTNNGWQYVSHEDVFGDDDPVKKGQDVLFKLTMPVQMKESVLAELDRYNLNAHTLFGTEDALIEAVTRRHWR